MTLEEFKNKYLGKQVEYHSFGAGALNQCVDLVNQYIKEVLNLTPIIGANAKDFPEKYNKDEFEWIVNDPLAIPKAGDIPVWNGNVGGGAGHIAIVLSAGLNAFQSLDQNWSISERVTLENHNYNNIRGWLRPKYDTIKDNMVQVDSETFERLVTKSTAYDELLPQYEATKKLLHDNEETNKQKDKRIHELEGELEVFIERNEELAGENDNLRKQITELEDEIEAMESADDDEDSVPVPETPENPPASPTEPQESPLVTLWNKILHWFR